MTISQIKKYYEEGRWDEARLQKLVDAGTLTQEQYNEIVSDSEGEE